MESTSNYKNTAHKQYISLHLESHHLLPNTFSNVNCHRESEVSSNIGNDRPAPPAADSTTQYPLAQADPNFLHKGDTFVTADPHSCNHYDEGKGRHGEDVDVDAGDLLNVSHGMIVAARQIWTYDQTDLQLPSFQQPMGHAHGKNMAVYGNGQEKLPYHSLYSTTYHSLGQTPNQQNSATLTSQYQNRESQGPQQFCGFDNQYQGGYRKFSIVATASPMPPPHGTNLEGFEMEYAYLGKDLNHDLTGVGAQFSDDKDEYTGMFLH